MNTLLVIDDEASILLAFRRAFQNRGITVHTAETGGEGLRLVKETRPSAIVLDVQLPDLPGLEVFRRIRLIDARIPVVLISGKATTDTAIEAMKLGAYDYLFKPLELDQLRHVVDTAFAVSRTMQVPTVLAHDETPIDHRADAIIGRCPPMQEVYKAIGRVANQDVTVLITGESGTGKELVARAIYQHGRRAGGPFLAINCAAIPESLLESELFGHEKGAFTGAERQRIGKFEQCNGGTLFLDEVGDTTPLTQTKILRVLQEKMFERLGGNETVKTDVRVLAATNHDLEALVAAGKFRQDLYYRLGVFSIKLPPLRERGEDIALLVPHYLRRFQSELSKDVTSVSAEAMALLRSYPWPGNVRELQSVLKQGMLRASGSVLLPDFLPPVVTRPPEPAAGTGQDGGLQKYIDDQLSAGSNEIYAESVAYLERILLTRVLSYTKGNQKQAAARLGITRGSLRNKLRDLGISVSKTVESPEADDADGA